jgi:hypothetical protein
VRVLGTGVNLEFAIEGAAEAVVRDHATDGAFDEKLRAALTACTESLGFVTTDESREAHVGLGDFLFAADGDLGGVEDNDEVAGVNMRSEDGFVFSAKEIGGLNGDAAERLAGGVDDPPVALHLFGFG